METIHPAAQEFPSGDRVVGYGTVGSSGGQHGGGVQTRALMPTDGIGENPGELRVDTAGGVVRIGSHGGGVAIGGGQLTGRTRNRGPLTI